MKLINEKGYIKIDSDVIASISGYAAAHCFGVKGITTRNVSDGILQLLGIENMSKGIKITYADGGIGIELHVAVEHGVNITVIGESIMNEVRFVVEHDTGLKVRCVDVFIDYVDVSNE